MDTLEMHARIRGRQTALTKECEHRAVTRETLPAYHETLMGLPIVLVHAVEIKKCAECGQVLSRKIPDLQNLIAAMAVARIGNPMKLWGDDIRFLRKALNWTAKELAGKLEVTDATISRWETGKELIGIANEKVLRLIVGTAMHVHAPAVDFDPERIATMKIEGARRTDVPPMCFERVRYKAPDREKEDQWDSCKAAA